MLTVLASILLVVLEFLVVALLLAPHAVARALRRSVAAAAVALAAWATAAASSTRDRIHRQSRRFRWRPPSTGGMTRPPRLA